MTITTAETLTANGVVLNTLAYNVASIAGRLRTPPKRGDNLPVAGRHGALRTRRKRFDAGEVVLPMWVVGADEDGLPPTETSGRARFFANYDQLVRVFSADTVELVHTLPDGTSRRCIGEVTDTLDPEVRGSIPGGKFSVALQVPGAFWEDADTVATSRVHGVGTHGCAEFAGATAPMDDLAVSFVGPANNPHVACGDVWVSYLDVLDAGQSVTVDAGTWTITGSGVSADYGRLRYGGDTRWFVLDPADPAPQVTVSTTDAADSPQTVLTGRRKFLTG